MSHVISAAMSGEFPFDKSPAINNQYVIEGRQGSADSKPTAKFNVVSFDYFRTLEISTSGGRSFDRRDRHISRDELRTRRIPRRARQN